ncbi:MAG TPA: DUF1329 domain-containing protein [Geminicoccaceae bacterium]
MNRAAITLAFAICALSAPAEGKVPVEEAARLGRELTPLGAIRAGNDEGTIPAWQGGILRPPADYRPGSHHADPFVDDAPLFTITAADLEQYAARLSPGQIAMFERYPETWRMPVYPTRRSASLPQRIYDRTIANATNAELTPDGNGVLNAAEGIPFPIPQNGLEAIWNHLLRYRGVSVHRQTAQVTPTARGDYTEVRIDEKAVYLYAQEGATVASIDNRLAYLLQSVTAPPRLAGTILLVHETLNQKAELRQAWTYNPGQRRVRRAPNIAHDNPGTASDGQRTSDQLDMFNGAPDRYDWQLVGRRELYIPYNNYRLHSDALRHDQIIQPGHVNPDYTRYELHRVWEVDAKLKNGTSHVYAQRRLYLDEDSWQIVVADHYDRRGQLWRVAEAYTINYYENPLLWETLFCVYDLQNGRYLAFGLNNELEVDQFDIELEAADFTPDALRRLGRR